MISSLNDLILGGRGNSLAQLELLDKDGTAPAPVILELICLLFSISTFNQAVKISGS
jgi:hypothetical protein